MSRELAGQTALVTGGSRGIGRAVAQALAAAGARVVLTYREREAAAREVVEAIKAGGGQAEAAQLEVADGEAVRELVRTIVDRHGKIDVLVNNAGLSVDALLLRLRDSDWERVLAVNLGGVLHCCRAAARSMVRAHYGRIVNLTSVVGEMGNVGQAAYAAAKAGVIGLTRSLARELGSRGITVNAVAPGFVSTEMTAGMDAGRQGMYASMIPLGRFGTVDEVAAAVLFLASPRAGYITGHVLRVNGGLYM